MSAAYLKSVVLTESSISSGSRSALWGTSSGDLPQRIHWHGITFFWPGVLDQQSPLQDPASVEFFDGSSSTSALITFDYRPGLLQAFGAWKPGASAMMLEDDSYIRIDNGLNIEFTFATIAVSQGDAVMTVFYK